MWQTLIGNYVSFFTLLPHTPPLFLKTWKIRILIKQKTIAGDIIILHMCTKNHNHMRYGSWDTEWNRGLFCHIGQFFALFPPKNTENQNFEDWKKHLEISSFYTCVPQMKIIWCAVPDIWSTTHIIFCHFGPVFSLLRP